MRKAILSIVSLLILSAFFTATLSAKQRGILPISPTGTEVTGDQWLFVIGIDTYIHWPRLKTAVSDAQSVKDVLLSRYYYDKDHLIELYDEQATRTNILANLRFLANKVSEDDSLLIFYAGHGHLDSITKEGSWIPVESGTKDVSAWISNHDIKNYLKVDAIKAKHILLISDSCFSGDFFRGRRGKLPKVTDEVIKRAYRLTSRQAITSGGLEPVADEGFGQNSVFSHFVVKTLKENQKPFLIPSDFFPDIKAGVAENAEQFPQFGSLKDTGGQQGGELVLFLKQESRLNAIAVETSEREKELAYLKKLEQADQEAKQREAAEIARYEQQLAQLDARIIEMKKRLGTSLAKEDDSLDAMLAMVRQKEEQQQRLEELKRKREQEEARRLAEIERLKAEKRQKLIAAVEEDIGKYKEIVSSPFGKDMKETAWKSLVAKYAEAGKDLKAGDTEALLFNVKWSNAEPTFSNSIGMKFILIPPGTFTMGSPHSEKGRYSNETQHEVTLRQAFYLQTTEVTQRQWKAVMGTNPSNFKDCGADCPAERVSWNDCQEFIRRLNQKEGTNRYRLPTEAEWEYACRAGTTTAFANGGITETGCDRDPNLAAMGWYCGNAGNKTHPVAHKNPNAWDLYNMHGNVYEWCEDWYGDYPNAHVTDPKGPSSGTYRVLRGGSWGYGAGGCRAANRGWGGPGYRDSGGGFRLVRDLN